MNNPNKARRVLAGAMAYIVRRHHSCMPMDIARVDIGDAEALLVLGEALRALQTPSRKKRCRTGKGF